MSFGGYHFQLCEHRLGTMFSFKNKKEHFEPTICYDIAPFMNSCPLEESDGRFYIYNMVLKLGLDDV